VHLKERPRELRIADDRLGKEDAGREIRLFVARELAQVGDLDDEQAGRPGLSVDRVAGVTVGRVPGDELARRDQVVLTPTARPHRLSADDSEDVLAPRLDCIPGRPARHQQDPLLAGRPPDPNPLGLHLDEATGGKNVQDEQSCSHYDGPVQITPHIVVQDAERATAFYRDAFGAEELSRIPTPDGRLMSVQLRLGDGALHLADEFPEMGVLAPPSIGGTPVVLALDVDDAEAVFAQALAAGAQVRQPLQEAFWGDLHGQLDDPFGHRWNVAQHLRDVPHDEVVAAAARALS
jgi:PhnB protein